MQCQGKKIPGRRSCQNYIPSPNIRFRYMRGNVRRRIRSHWYRGRQCMDNYCSQSLCTRCKISRDCRPPLLPPLSKKKMNIRSSRNILSWVWTIITDICTLKSFLKKVQQKKFEYFICNSDNPNFTPIILRKCHTLTHPL